MSAEFPRAGFWRRFASLIYDTLVIIAFAMLTTVLYLLAVQGLISLDLLSIGDAEDVSAFIQNSPLLYGIRSALLVVVVLVSLAIFGLKAAKLLVCVHGV